jgi:hypothetical protein
MTTKAAFNADEWSTITTAPALTAMGVAMAERGGTLRESISMARAYAEARREGSGELVREVVSTPPAIDPAGIRSPDDVTREGADRLRDAVALLEGKATPEELPTTGAS